jgi:hypothetical protein
LLTFFSLLSLSENNSPWKMENQNEKFGDGFRQRRNGPILVATGAHSDGFTPERTPERPIEMSRLLLRPSVDNEVNELVELSDTNSRSAQQWNGSDAESLVSNAGSSGFSRICHPSHLELKRPDSVITTSSLVSSSDTASQVRPSTIVTF